MDDADLVSFVSIESKGKEKAGNNVTVLISKPHSDAMAVNAFPDIDMKVTANKNDYETIFNNIRLSESQKVGLYRLSLRGIRPKRMNVGTLILRDDSEENKCFIETLLPKIYRTFERVSNKLFTPQLPTITDSAQLENSIFSPKTHRPNVEDFPIIDTIQDTGRAKYGVGSYLTNLFSKPSPLPSCFRQIRLKSNLHVGFKLPPVRDKL